MSRDGEEAGGKELDAFEARGRLDPDKGSVGESLGTRSGSAAIRRRWDTEHVEGTVRRGLAGLASTAAADASRVVTFMREAIGLSDKIASVEAGGS